MNKTKLKAIIKRVPLLGHWSKLIYDFIGERKLNNRVNQMISKKELPYCDQLPERLSVGHEPTIRCNLRCKMCYQGETRELRREELDTNNILSIYKKLEERMTDIKLVGGEPMVRDDIINLIAYLNNNNKKISLQTNCTLFNQDNILKLRTFTNLKDIITSLDGPKEIHDNIRGVPGAFSRLEESLKLIRLHLPWVKITVFATLLLKDNLDKMLGLIDTCKQLKIETINILFEQVYSTAEINQTKKILKNIFDWDEEDYRINTQTRDPIFSTEIKSVELKKKLEAIRNYGFKRGCYVNFTPFNYYDHLDKYIGEQKGKAFCLKLLNSEIRINQEGDVVWCDIIEKSFGNLVKKSIEEIWSSTEYQKFRKYLFTNSFPICSRCCKAIYREDI
ncbi:MAG: radical SAM protein [Candidatus Falkowbacteria bacterium]|nr:radical SAM protein [Candidatus Falkowbacteria bacterium]